MSFCDQMAAAIDGARTRTRFDHLSRSIWQSLTAGAVADDDAQALAERLHARRSVLRGEIKPVGIPAGRPSIFPPRRLQRAPQRLSRLPAVGTWPPPVRCRLRWPASSRSASWRCYGSWGMRFVSTANVIDALMSLRRGQGSADGWFKCPSRGGSAWACDGRGTPSRRPPQPTECGSDRLKGMGDVARQGRAVAPPARRTADRVQKNAPHGQSR
jgi:hypothetical protein